MIDVISALVDSFASTMRTFKVAATDWQSWLSWKEKTPYRVINDGLSEGQFAITASQPPTGHLDTLKITLGVSMGNRYTLMTLAPLRIVLFARIDSAIPSSCRPRVGYSLRTAV